MSVKTFKSPVTQRTLKFGRKRPALRGLALLPFAKYLDFSALPPPPASVDYTLAATKSLSQMFLNDQLGDCVPAFGGHFQGVVTANSGNGEFVYTNNQIQTDYERIGGYIPGDPNSDAGCDEQVALKYWTQTGFANGDKLEGWLAVDATNKVQVQYAIWLFENVMFGVELPDQWLNHTGPNFVWDVAGSADPENGHCFGGFGFGPSGLIVSTWGEKGTITYDATAKYAGRAAGGELYVLLTDAMISKASKKAPNGLDWTGITKDWNALGGNVPVPTPVPVPPSPTPVPPVPTPTQLGTLTANPQTGIVTLGAGWTATTAQNLRGFSWGGVANVLNEAVALLQKDGGVVADIVVKAVQFAGAVTGKDVAAIVTSLTALSVDVNQVVQDIKTTFGLN